LVNNTNNIDLNNEIILNTKNKLFQDDNNKSTFKNKNCISDLISHNSNVAEETLNSNYELQLLKKELLKIKEQFNIINSNNLLNRTMPNFNYPTSNPYINNFSYGFPQSKNQEKCLKGNDNNQSTFLIGNVLDYSNHDQEEGNCNTEFIHNDNLNDKDKIENNQNANIYNNFISSNSMSNPMMNFMHFMPFLFPFNMQPNPCMNPFIQNSKFTNRNKDILNYYPTKNSERDDCEKTDLITEPNELNLESSLLNLDLYTENNFKQNSSKFTKKNMMENSNYNFNVPPNVNTFNMVFINTKLNDVSLGHRRIYRRKDPLLKIEEGLNQEINEKTTENSNKKKVDKPKKINKKTKNVKKNK